METLLISACLMGYNCKYNGGNNALPQDVLAALRQRYRLLFYFDSQRFFAERFDAHTALLKANSPSCGSGTVYDGSFSGRLVSGDGVTAEYLKSKNLIIFKNPSTLLT